MGIQETIFYGVLSGILTTVVLLISSTLFKNVLVPWFRGLVYRGVDLAGKWDAGIKISEEEKDKFTLFLKQTAHSLTGSLILVQERKEWGLMSADFRVSGETFNGFVVLNLRSTDPRQTGLASVVARVIGGGKRLEGKMTFQNIMHESLHTIDVNFHRPI